MQKKNSTFYPQLDSLRALAVILVIFSHWFAKEHILNRYTNNGTLGVTLFFVLSGFLITGILLKNKLQIEHGSSMKEAFKIFYIRRSLRIFPLYYLVLIILVIYNVANIKESFWWHFFYGSNFYFWIQGKFGGSLSHLWSLAVEEQFYLFWPAIIFFIPRKYLQQVFLIGVVAAVLFRWAITTPQNDIGRILMPGSLDSFCLGGLFAYGRLFSTSWYQSYLKNRNSFILAGFFLLIFVHLKIFTYFSGDNQLSIYYLLVSVAFVILIDRVADTVTFTPIGTVLSSKILLFIGKISYGIYLFHNLIPFLYGIKLPLFLQPFSYHIIQSLRFLLLISIASLSWYVFEKPILKLKQHFEYI